MSKQNPRESLLRDRPIVAAAVNVDVVTRRPESRLQNPAAITIHDRRELCARVESEPSHSSAGVDIADVLRREIAVVAWARNWDCELVVDEGVGVPCVGRGRAGGWVDCQVPRDDDWVGAEGVGTARGIEVVVVGLVGGGGGSGVGALVAVCALADAAGGVGATGEHGCWCCWCC